MTRVNGLDSLHGWEWLQTSAPPNTAVLLQSNKIQLNVRSTELHGTLISDDAAQHKQSGAGWSWQRLIMPYLLDSDSFKDEPGFKKIRIRSSLSMPHLSFRVDCTCPLNAFTRIENKLSWTTVIIAASVDKGRYLFWISPTWCSNIPFEHDKDWLIYVHASQTSPSVGSGCWGCVLCSSCWEPDVPSWTHSTDLPTASLWPPHSTPREGWALQHFLLRPNLTTTMHQAQLPFSSKSFLEPKQPFRKRPKFHLKLFRISFPRF